MPLEQPAMMLMVPVGAIVVTVALRTRAPAGLSKMEPSKLGNTPRSRASEELARERGVFPNFEGSIFDSPAGARVRNATVTTIAPTGTISIIAGCSSGIEPLFAISYVRANVLDDDRMVEGHPYFEQVARQRGFLSDELMKQIAEVGSVRHLDGVPPDVQQVHVLDVVAGG